MQNGLQQERASCQAHQVRPFSLDCMHDQAPWLYYVYLITTLVDTCGPRPFPTLLVDDGDDAASTSIVGAISEEKDGGTSRR